MRVNRLARFVGILNIIAFLSVPVTEANARHPKPESISLDILNDLAATDSESDGEEPDISTNVLPSVFNGADGVEFLPIPIDTSMRCNSILLKGTRRFEGTVFMLPRVLVSTNKQKETLFEIIRLGENKYLLRFAVFFPRTDEDLELRMSDSQVHLQGCNLNEVLYDLNKDIVAESKKIKRISRVPVSSAAVRIDGVAKPYILGGGNSSMFHYQGADHVAEFIFNSREELEAVLARIQGSIGLGIHVQLMFNARSGDGSVHATVDLRQVAASIGAALSGRKLIAAGELRALLNNEVRKLKVDIQTEAGSSGAHLQIVDDIMALITGATLKAGNWKKDSKIDTSSGLLDPGLNTDNGSSGQHISTQDPPTAPTLGSGQLFSVSTVLDVLRKQTQLTINYDHLGLSQQHTYTTSVLFRGEIEDPDVRTIHITSNETKGRRLSNKIIKDQPVSIAATSIGTETLDYGARKRYFTAKQLRDLEMHEKFPALRNENFAVIDRKMKFGVAATMRAKPSSPFNNEFLTWGAGELFLTPLSSTNKELDLSEASLRTLPLAIHFSKVGARKFKIDDLLTETRLWKGEYDELGGRMIFTPKANLGQMTLWNLAPSRSRTLPRRWYFQEHRNAAGIISRQFADVVNEAVPLSLTTIRLQITADSDAGELIGLIKPEGSHNTASPILVPQPE